jgi:hypothetical protein
MNRKMLWVLLTSGFLLGLGGCSEGDKAEITISAPTTTTTTDNSVGGSDCSGDNSCSTGGDNSGTGDTGGTGGTTDTAPCPAGTTETEADICELSGSVMDDMTLVAGNVYTLNGRVIVGNGNCLQSALGTCSDGTAVENVTLTIAPGVEVKGLPSNDPLTAAVLDVNRGSRLVAVGTAASPIVFSSAVDSDYAGSGEWGGVQLTGYAPHNNCSGDPCNVDGEGAVNYIGGNNPADSSGVLKYVIITEGGTEISTGDEINGLSLNAVGSGTVMDFIQINDNLDDGVELYGGTANIKHLVVTNAGDDSVDWDEGYQGNLQYVMIRQGADSQGESFEMDTEGTTAFLSKPTVANVTLIGASAAGKASFMMNFKKSSAGFFHNVVATTTSDSAEPQIACANIDASSAPNVGSSLVFNNWIQDCAPGVGDQGTLAVQGGAAFDMGAAAINVTPVYANLNSLGASQASAARLSAPISWGAVNTSFAESVADASFLDATDYIGAVDPDAASAWWASWTLEGTVGNPSTGPVACPTGTTEVSTNVCLLPATITEDMHLVAGNVYQLEGRTIVGNGNCQLTAADTCSDGSAVLNVTLTIDAGVEIKGLPSADPLQASVLDVNRGSQLIAIGTASAPIIFSSADSDYSGSGEWGGVQLTGYGPHNACTTDPCNVDGEGAVNYIGGNNPNDSSGVLKYVIITEGGTEISTGDEINGLSLNAVGAGTVMDYIQINDNLDDGVEFYGGTASIKHLVVTNAGDDSVDWDEGYQGNLQYVLVKQGADSNGEGFEMDTEGTTAWLSKPTVVNGTVIATKAAGGANYILNFKKSSAGFFHNMVVTALADSPTALTTCANIDASSVPNVGTTLVFNNWVQDCGSNGFGGTLATSAINAATVSVESANLDANYASQAAAASGLTAIDWTTVEATYSLPSSPADPLDFDASFFDPTTYAGAVDPAGTAWWAGWTLVGTL